MKPNDDLRLLAEQLDQAWTEWRSGAGEALEIAALAGLAERLDADSPRLEEARAARDELAPSLDDLDLDAAVDRLIDLEEGCEPEEMDAALFDLDELGAAATFLGRPDLVAGAIDLAVRVIHAFPEAFAPRSGLATALLERTPPRPGDPALALWRAVESAAVARADSLAGPPALEARYRLGLPVVISSREVVESARMAASDVLPPEAPWIRVAHGDGWEVAITAEGGAPQVAVASPSGASAVARRDGAPVALVAGHSGVALARAEPGAWEVDVAGQTVAFQVEP